MIEEEILLQTAKLLKNKSWEVREQSALLLSAFALSAIGRQSFEYAFPNLKDLLEDNQLEVR